VRALFVHDGQLYVGGDFTSCDGLTCSFVARWDGIGWSAFGSGLNGPVFSMTEISTRTVHRWRLHEGRIDRGQSHCSVGWAGMAAGFRWRQRHGLCARGHGRKRALCRPVCRGAFVQQDLARIAWYHPAYQTLLATVWEGSTRPYSHSPTTTVALWQAGHSLLPRRAPLRAMLRREAMISTAAQTEMSMRCGRRGETCTPQVPSGGLSGLRAGSRQCCKVEWRQLGNPWNRHERHCPDPGGVPGAALCRRGVR